MFCWFVTAILFADVAKYGVLQWALLVGLGKNLKSKNLPCRNRYGKRASVTFDQSSFNTHLEMGFFLKQNY